MDYIHIVGASENNLKHVSLDIPKYKITAFTGVSGSGKSSLVMDTIAAKSRRELNETFSSFVQQYLPKYGRPHVDSIQGLPVAIVIDQKKPAKNSRSTVGTYTDIYALVRLLFSRVGKPFVGYSDTFSFNNPQGCCPRCSGLGEIRELDIHKLVDFDKSLNDEDTIHYIAFGKGGWRWIRYAHSGLFDLDKKIKDYSAEELELFLNSPQIKLKNPPANWPKSAKYEGLIPRMYRSIINSEEGLLHAAVLNPMLNMGECPDCHGTRLNPKVLECRINGLNISEACDLSISRMNQWLRQIDDPLAVDFKKTIGERLTALEEIGLGYISLSRPLDTLSGGEAQRCKIAKYIHSSLADVLYILDEPSVGLHNRDIELMKRSVCHLRDAGNTVLLVEHHKEMIKIADNVVDMGPGAGALGGEVLFQGSYDELLASGTSTGRMIGCQMPLKEDVRQPRGFLRVEHATLHNLKDVSVDFPLGVLGVVAGVAGSGKSSLMQCVAGEVGGAGENGCADGECGGVAGENGCSVGECGGSVGESGCAVGECNGAEGKSGSAAGECNGPDGTCGGSAGEAGCVAGEVVYISQKSLSVSLRSTPATYLEVAGDIRKLFAKSNKVREEYFTFNGKGGCPVCGGKGVIVSEMAFMDDIETLCEACGGLRYSAEALQYRYGDKNIAEVMDLTARLAAQFFAGTPIERKLQPLIDVGLGYLHLNQSLSTLSGGELQRLKLASLLGTDPRGKFFVIDEPSDGLHMQDVQHILSVFDRLVDAGNTVYLIEHNLDIIRRADYVIELGPGAGEDGGLLVFHGHPRDLSSSPQSVTGRYM